MIDWTREQRAMAAAHLCDLASRALRLGDYYAEGLLSAKSILDNGHPEALYRFALDCYGVESADIDAAVASILRGEHPADSLPGRVKRLLGNAENDGEDIDVARTHGRCDAYADVLDLLGVAK